MSRDYGWRASCLAGGVTDVVVGSSAWFGSFFSRKRCIRKIKPNKNHNAIRSAGQLSPAELIKILPSVMNLQM